VKRIIWLMLALLLAPLPGPALAQPALVAAPPAALRYLWPSNGAQFVPPGATLALRLDGPHRRPQTLSAGLFHLVGASAGPHAGQVRLADDGCHGRLHAQYSLHGWRARVGHHPARPGHAGWRGVRRVADQLQQSLSWRRQFPSRLAPVAPMASCPSPRAAARRPAPQPAPSAAAGTVAAPNSVSLQPQDFVTLPSDFPAYTVTVCAHQHGSGPIVSKRQSGSAAPAAIS